MKARKRTLRIMSRLLIAAVVTLALNACQKAQVIDPSKLQWLNGTWRVTNSEGQVFESWKPLSNGGLEGVVYALKDSDSVVVENITVQQLNDGLYYIPVVNGQNNGEAVPFMIVSLTDSMFVAANKGHDFPQQISYKLCNDGSLCAEISGKLNGTDHVEKFPMQRVKTAMH